MVSTLPEYRRRRAEMISYLGGTCVECGTTELLELDHIDREQKSFYVGHACALSWHRPRPELDTCQLRCRQHNVDKSIRVGDLPPRAECPSPRAYRNGCRCPGCRAANSAYQKAYRQRRRLRSG